MDGVILRDFYLHSTLHGLSIMIWWYLSLDAEYFNKGTSAYWSSRTVK